MQLIFCMEGNIKAFRKLILSFLAAVASMPKILKITSLQYLTNNMVDYLDFSYVYRVPNHGSNPLHKSQSKTIANDHFYIRKQGAELETLLFNFVDFLVKIIYARSQKANGFFLTSYLCPRQPNILVKIPFIMVFISVDHVSIS